MFHFVSACVKINLHVARDKLVKFFSPMTHGGYREEYRHKI